jgi:hypothetical protein
MEDREDKVEGPVTSTEQNSTWLIVVKLGKKLHAFCEIRKLIRVLFTCIIYWALFFVK